MKDDDAREQLIVTEEEVDLAWERLFEKVKKEPASDFWMNAAETEQNHSIHPIRKDEAPPLSDPAPSAEERKVWRAVSDETIRRNKPKRRTKRWLTAGMTALVAGLLLFSPLGQKVMASMMSHFRIQHFETVSLTNADLDAFRQALSEGTSGARQFELRRYGEIEQHGGGQARVVDMDEANVIAAGHPLKQLKGASLQEVTYQPQQELIVKLHTKEMNTMIAILGGKTSFPKSVDGKPIHIYLPGSFQMQASDKSLIQLPAPSLDVPEGVDLEQVRQAILDLPMLPDSIRSKLAGIGDWRHTLPIPTNGDDVRSLMVDGQEVVLSVNDQGRSLIWLQDGWVYVLRGSTIDFPTDESLINEAKGLIQS